MPPTDSNQVLTSIARAIWSIRREFEDRCDMELEDCHPEDSVWKEAAAVLALSAAPQSDGWRPISDAPEGVLLVVGWLDPEDTEHPERHDFDYLEDGVWQQHSNNVEHFDMCAPPGSRGPSNEAPYTHFMRVAAIPTTQTQGQSHGE